METAIGITICDKDTTEIGQSDLKGYFQIKLPNEADTLIFAGVGYEWSTITVPKECKNLEIILFLAATYDFMSNRKVDRLRKKEFEKISDLHYQAFQNGLFTSEKPCAYRQFKPIEPELDKIAKRLSEQAKENKNDFKNLGIGDSVKIPFGIDDSGKMIRTKYSSCGNCTEEDYEYLIEGIIINKKRRKLTLEIKITEMPFYNSLEYNEQILSVNSNFKYEMKYFEVVTE